METTQPSQAREKGDFIVPSLRLTDAIGSALRGAFGSRIDLPDDMRAMLDRIGASPTNA